MVDEPKAQTPVPEPKGEMEEAVDVLREYGVPIVTGLIAAAVVLGGWKLYTWKKVSANVESAALLNSARNATELQEVAQQYAGTPSGPVAQLALAATYFGQGQFSQAQQAYTTFMQVHPDHPMYASAELGIAQVLDGAGSADQALAAFTAFVGKYPDHYLTPIAELGRGSSLEALGRLDDARVVYEDFIAANPESPWLDEAETLLRFLNKGVRMRERPGGTGTDFALPTPVTPSPVVLPDLPDLGLSPAAPEPEPVPAE